MISCLRVDERLLHGQVVTKWLTAYAPQAVVIADDHSFNDPIAKMALKMAKPADLKMSICTVDNAIKLLHDPRTEKMKLLVLCRNTAQALKISEKCHIQDLNLGGIRSTHPDAKAITGVVKFAPEDFENIKTMIRLVDSVDLRTVPSEKKRDINKYL